MIPPIACGPRRRACLQGFSLLEMVLVVAIMLVVAAFAVPMWTTAMRTARIRGSEADYASLLQMARTRAVNDDRYYSVYIQPAAGNVAPLAYVDIYPQNVNGTSGAGAPPGGAYAAGPPADPMVPLSPEAVPQTQASAPNTGNLLLSFCGSCAAAIVKNTPPTWGPDGLPCAAAISAGGTGTVCASGGGPIAYAVYFQSSTTQEWDAVTISPAGRIKTWYCIPGCTAWSAFNQ